MIFFSRNFFVVAAVALLSACSAENSSDEPAVSLAEEEALSGKQPSEEVSEIDRRDAAIDKRAEIDRRAEFPIYSEPAPQGEPSLLTCLPGCWLDNDDEKRPVVPEWCTAWAPHNVLCSTNGDNSLCAGTYRQKSIATTTPNITDFHLGDLNRHDDIPEVNEQKFVCIQIDLTKLANGIGRHAPRDDPGQWRFPPRRKYVACSPGCTISSGPRGENEELKTAFDQQLCQSFHVIGSPLLGVEERGAAFPKLIRESPKQVICDGLTILQDEIRVQK